MALPQPEVLTPPREPWNVFQPYFVGQWRQGQHCLFMGPTGSGKTVAARTLARNRQYSVALGTKPVDPEMEAFIAEGYVRIDHWPPTRSDYKQGRWPAGVVRFVLWPKITKRADLRRFRDVYARALDDMFVDKNWCVIADEGLWLCKRNGLDLGDHLEAIAYAGRSSGVTLMMLIQRPAGVPRNTWSNASYAFIWNHGVTSDTRELASLGTMDVKAVKNAIQSLGNHEFLFLPCRAGMSWAISEVDIHATAQQPRAGVK